MGINIKHIVTLFLALFLSTTSNAAPPQPEVLLYERNPWLTVIGADSPVFAAYQTGQIIWQDNSPSQKQGDNQRQRYKSVTLDQKEYSELLSKLNEVLPLDDYYDLSDITDQPSTMLYLKISGEEKKITVYGSLNNESVRSKAPKELVNVYDYLKNYQHTGTASWNPEYIEVLAWPYNSDPENIASWPENWPDTESEQTRRHGDLFSIYLPVKYEQNLSRFLEKVNEESGAIKMNGKIWAISTRIPFPHEEPD